MMIKERWIARLQKEEKLQERLIMIAKMLEIILYPFRVVV